MTTGNDIEERRGPRHIDFYIKFWEEEKKALENDIQNFQKDILFFKERKLKNDKDREIRAMCDNAIKDNLRFMDEDIKKISVLDEKIKEFKALKESYAEDAKLGLYYDKDTGKIINESPVAEKPAEAY
jgi:hypothetical protein